MHLLLIGCGKMGGALLARWRQSPGIITHFDIIDPTPGHNAPDAAWHRELAALPAEYSPDIVVFAVKPAQLEGLLPDYARRFGVRPLYLSVAAGKTLDFYHKHLGEHVHMVRAMPNTPALIGQGMTVLVSRPTLPESVRHLATRLLEAVGHVAWLEDERQMNAVTAISGCGPAYMFLFLDALVKAGAAAGLSESLAKTLALHTMAGGAALAAASHESLAQLRINVASPGGSTEAALKVLMQGNALENLVKEAVLAAKKRAGEQAAE